jgi:hypothetical protein
MLPAGLDDAVKPSFLEPHSLRQPSRTSVHERASVPAPPYPAHSRGGPPPPLKQTVATISRLRATTTKTALASNRCPQSSRICPANDRVTSRNDGNGWSIESAGQEPVSAIAAGSEIGSENTLKVETRVRTPLGLPGETGNGARSDPSDIHHQRSARRSRSWMACRMFPSSRPRSVME